MFRCVTSHTITFPHSSDDECSIIARGVYHQICTRQLFPKWAGPVSLTSIHCPPHIMYYCTIVVEWLCNTSDVCRTGAACETGDLLWVFSVPLLMCLSPTCVCCMLCGVRKHDWSTASEQCCFVVSYPAAYFLKTAAALWMTVWEISSIYLAQWRQNDKPQPPDQFPSCKRCTYLQYVALDICYICDILQSPGSGRQLLVATSTSASVSSVKAVRSLLCSVITLMISLDIPDFWNDMSLRQECGVSFPDCLPNGNSHF